MSDCRNPGGRWRPADGIECAVVMDDTGKIPFVDSEAAARYLLLSPHSLESYRSLGGGPPIYKFGKFVRYAVDDLVAWAASRGCERTAGDRSRTY